MYVGLLLSTAHITDGSDGTLGEPISGGNGYNRVSTLPAVWDVYDIASSSMVNLSQITFPTCLADWADGVSATITGFALYTSGTPGAADMFMRGTFSSPQIIIATQIPDFGAGQLITSWVVG